MVQESSRRKSIAVTNQNNKPSVNRKRRAHSIAPGERLSPVSKARRSLGPRKSILKPSLNIPLYADPDEPNNATESMDSTHTEFRTEITDNNARKSMGRRVSFAKHAHVRMFEKQEQNTNGSDSPQSSPSAAHSSPPQSDAPRPMQDENAYPGAFQRRQSTRSSMGEASMDMDMDDTAPGPSAFLRGSALEDDEFSPDEDEGEDMDITNVLGGMIPSRRSSLAARRRSSVAPAAPRPPLAVVSAQPPPDDDNTQSTNYSEETSQYTDEDGTQPMEYTVPIARALNPPEKNEAWLALRAITHSGDTPHSPHDSDEEDDAGGRGEQGMELTDAMDRLMAARASLGAPPATGEDSFTSTEDSFGSGDAGDATMNVTSLMRRESGGRMSIGRMSLGPGDDETMDETSVFGDDEVVNNAVHVSPPAPVPAQSTPAPSRPPVFQSKPTVFTAQQTGPRRSLDLGGASPSVAQTPKPLTIPQPFQFSFTPKNQQPQGKNTLTPGSISPAKARPSAAFAPPVVRPSPKKRPAPDHDDENADPDTAHKPSPAKKLAFSTSSSSSKPVPKPLSPSKKAPFQSPASAKPPSKSLRRPSGYFAQRKSLAGAGVAPAPPPQPNQSAQKRAGRASVAGPGTGDAWRRFDPQDKTELPAPQQKGKGKAREDGYEREAAPPQRPAATSPAHVSPAHESPVEYVDSAAPDGSMVDSLAAPTTDHASSAMDTDGDDTALNGQEMTAQWREGVQEQSFTEDEGPPISIEQFFAMTGIRFMDELAAPRRSMHPSQLRTRARAHSPSATPPPDLPLSDYVVAMSVDVPQLELFTHVSKDLQAWIERSRALCAEAEEEALKMTPELFREYSQSDEENQAELLHQLKMIKANAHGRAKGEWYDWKLQWIEQLYATAEQAFDDLEADAKVIDAIVIQVQEIVPSLREEHERVMRELEEEQRIDVELQNSDQGFINELRETITEQDLQVEAMTAEVAEANAKFERLKERLHELEAEKKETASAIAHGRQIIHFKNHSTLAEVIRKKDELEALEDLHMLRATKVQPDYFEFIYACQYRISIPCAKFKPLVERVHVSRVEGAKYKTKDPLPQLSDLVTWTSQRWLSVMEGPPSIRNVAQRFRDYFAAYSQLREQLRLLNLKYPTSVGALPEADDGSTGLKATATLIFPTTKSKAHVSYIFDEHTLATWPMSIAAVQAEVTVAYGPVSGEAILGAVRTRMSQAVPEDNYACLMDACIEVMETIV
ncbi:hypothetical protein PLICRDRAFT_131726 [Plicaturopsis crispa FD-325 SS-3]|nr:hypothetical protein PLICRDRAFT_131726 [Plicaturopsis crispa FD-325 SS-3]